MTRPTTAATWQPIETAPEDEPCLIATKCGTVGEASMLLNDDREPVWFWAGDIAVHSNHQPTHWQPLPPPPEGADKP